MMRALIGLSAAIAAGAWLGLLSAFTALPSEDGLDKLHLGAPAARAMLSFVAAYAVCEVLRRRFGARWPLLVPLTCFLGSALFGWIRYMESPPGVGAWGLDIVPLGAMLLTIWTVPVMAGVVVIGHGVVRLWSWLRREDVPSAPVRSM